VNRRSLLAAAAAATTTGIAGCLGGLPGNGDDGDDGDGDPTDDATPSPTGTPEGPRLVDQSFEVERVECGDEYGGHDVTTEDGVVTVEGVLDGSNGCYTAELVAVDYDVAADELSVEVEAVDGSDDDEACTTCIVEIEYVATFTFENGEPGRIEVDQRGASSGSASASSSVSESGSASGGTPANETDSDTANESDAGTVTESESGSGESTPEPTGTATRTDD
jgi:hypothetical protein